MATLLLQAAGGLLGGAFGTFGATVGTAAGALAGYWIDQRLFGASQHAEGPRLTEQRPMTAEEGVPVARAYGHVRLAGTVIWATRFEEETTTERQGGKGGPKVTTTTYSYFGNVAVALCEGPVAMVKRVWADGREIDLTEITVRVHTGEAGQTADPLLEVKQGADNTPAYRNIAYLVFERFPLEDFGNRIPQIEAEVIRPVGELEKGLTAVSVIPGATEHGLSPSSAISQLGPGETVEHNRHILYAGNDWSASIDELQAICPNLRHVSLIVTWFGDDLRAGGCSLRPGVTQRQMGEESPPWKVSGLSRQSADSRLVSRVEGRPAYGGTPTDASVIEAIRDLKARGLSVMLHPFIMMDVPQDNALPDPYDGAVQAPYPWRGRITCFPGPAQAGSADGTATAQSQVAAFVGATQPADLAVSGEMVVPGPGADWGYRRLVLHTARLAQIAGGVDAMLIGSELRGLTCLRNASNQFPFVDALRQLASDVRAILGPGCKLSYGADWSEYFGYHPADGSGDVFYHLDQLWAAPEIDAVGIDNYMPLSDWRAADAFSDQGNPDGMRADNDAAAMQAAIAAGEGFDWYYASDAGRADRMRSPITDGAHGKPWVYRYKDLVSWWSNVHVDRRGGAETGPQSPWVPYGKPIWMTETGCPAVDAGANQPNVFPDPKSSESARPHHSAGTRGDGVQRAFLTAHQRHWVQVGAPANPVAPGTSVPMVDPERQYIWAWDARPYPEFPRNGTIWGDGPNWLTGHWINGRLGCAPLAGLIGAIFADHGLPAPDVEAVRGVVQGMTVLTPGSIRQTLEPLVDAFGLVATDTGDAQAPLIRIADPDYRPVAVPRAQLCLGKEHGDRTLISGQADELPSEVVLRYRDALTDYRTQSARSRRRDGPSAMLIDANLPCTLHPEGALAVANAMLDRLWFGRDTLKFHLPLRFAGLEPGDVVAFDDNPRGHWRITAIDLTDRLEITARSIVRSLSPAMPPAFSVHSASPEASGRFGGPPETVLLDLPMLDQTTVENNHRIAVHAVPDRPHAVLSSPGADGFELRQTVAGNAIMGTLLTPLSPGPPGRYDRASTVHARLFGGEFSSVTRELLLAGRNALAVEITGGLFEVLQFRFAEEVAPGEWRLWELLRGQAGTDDAAAAGAPAGGRIVFLDRRVPPSGLTAAEAGRTLNWRIGPAGRTFSSRYFTVLTAIAGTRALLPLSPVHPRAHLMPDGAVQLSWIRRSRIGGDVAIGGSTPLGEERELYRVTLFDGSGAPIHTAEPDASSLTLSPAGIVSIFGSVPDAIDAEIRQVSARVGDGLAMRTILHLTPN
ncbi:host specificity protein [Oceaniradius stylonematis]|uniref:Host specificity protein n=1 Tax=Oceaniradius stylonematis TaxID=2184161 RepID=A0A3A8A9V2_9HYPH|nr:glycoside hydrolase/phage tail family protein [Oceaniradius stylonematis]RKF06696.1 host specificity protein [Oceaniradius stylonematis]